MTKYTVIEQINKGKFGIICKVIDKNQKEYVLKYVKIKHKKMSTELSILRMLKNVSPYFINLVDDHISKKGNLLLFFEMFSCQNMKEFIKTELNMTNSCKTSIIKQLLQGLQLLHSMNIVHMDIKPENILINNSYKIKYIDFGLACTPYDSRYKKYRGTVFYMDPNVLMNQVTTFSEAKLTDIWSLGITIYRLVHNCLPWISTNKEEVKKELENISHITSTDSQFKEIINNMLYKDFNKRYSLERLINLC